MAIYSRGVYLPQRKEPAASLPIADLEEPGRILLPFSNSEEQFASPSVQDYDTVAVGDVVARAAETWNCPVRSSVTGVVAGTQAVEHPLFGTMQCLAIDCVVAAQRDPFEHRDTESLTPQQIAEIARAAAIVDELDNVPLHRKLTEWSERPHVLLVADAVEGEPYSSSAYAVLSLYTRQVRDGLRLAAYACGAEESKIAVRLSRRRVTALKRHLGRGDLYALADATYPYDEIVPAKRGQNVCRIGVQACLALFRAAGYAEPQTSFVVTVTGDAVKKPRNVRVPIGTSAQAALQFCGLKTEPAAVVYGDAMTGAVSTDLSLPLLPGTTCLVALSQALVLNEQVCIGCGRCAHVCHHGLLPYEIQQRMDMQDYTALNGLHPWECDACGACSYSCPASRDVMSHVLEAALAAGTDVWGGGESDG